MIYNHDLCEWLAIYLQRNAHRHSLASSQGEPSSHELYQNIRLYTCKGQNKIEKHPKTRSSKKEYILIYADKMYVYIILQNEYAVPYIYSLPQVGESLLVHSTSQVPTLKKISVWSSIYITGRQTTQCSVICPLCTWFAIYTSTKAQWKSLLVHIASQKTRKRSNYLIIYLINSQPMSMMWYT